LPDLSRKRERERLAVRREPHWQRLAEGAYLGFRRGPDTWVVRYRGRDGRQQYHALDKISADDYDHAKRAAEEWCASLGASAVRRAVRGTVKDALDAYLADLKRHGRHETAQKALGQFKLAVYASPLGSIELESSTKEDFLDWRDGLLPKRKARTVNRLVRSVVAGLNRAVELGHVGNPAAWKLERLADEQDESETAIFLSPAQRSALIAAAEPHAAAFFRGLELTGARPKEMASATVADYDGESLRLAHRKGRPPKLRVRHVVLSAEGIRFFDEQTAGKLPRAFIFTENDIQPWRRHVWAERFRAARAEVNRMARGAERIPPQASTYSFRHARISELLQVHGIDPVTTALQCGTSLRMIEQVYHKFIASAMRTKLASVRETA
jgi:integrase